jgi:hypothetical protein
VDYGKQVNMAQPTFDQVLADVKALSPDEQRQLRDTLDAWLTVQPGPLTEAEFEQRLVAQGLLSAVPPPITDVTPYQHRTPIRLHGVPLSQTIIEERG